MSPKVFKSKNIYIEMLDMKFCNIIVSNIQKVIQASENYIVKKHICNFSIVLLLFEKQWKMSIHVRFSSSYLFFPVLDIYTYGDRLECSDAEPPLPPPC